MASKTVQKQMPSVGRQVHYIAYGTPGGEYPAGVKRALIVTQVHEPGNPESRVGVAVLNPTGFFFNADIPFGTEPGCWCWPEYVPPITVTIDEPDEAAE